MSLLKRFKGLIIFFLIMTSLFGALVVGKNIFLRQAKKKIEGTFAYTRLHLAYFPPSIVLDDVQTVSASKYFSAKQVTIQISYVSLLSKEKPLTVFIDHPVLRLSEASRDGKSEKRKAFWPLPFPIEKGLVRDGEIYYRLEDGEIRCRKIRALFTQKRDVFSLHAESEQNVFVPASGRPSFSGSVSLSVSGKGRDVTIHKLIVEGPELMLKADGKWHNPAKPVLELKAAFSVEMSMLAPLLDLPMKWQGRVEGRGLIGNKDGEFFFDSELNSRAMILNNVPLGKIDGRVGISGGTGGKIELHLQKKSASSEFVTIRFKKGRIEGEVSGARLDPIMSYAKVPWPVKSPVWGRFTLENKKLASEGEFRDIVAEPEDRRYPFLGTVLFDMDFASGNFSFSSSGLDSSFAKVDVQGGARIGRDVDITIRGEVKDVHQAREFTSSLLNRRFEFSAIRGKGTADVEISGDYERPRVRINFFCMPGGFDKFDAASVEGSLGILGDGVLGRFRVSDRNFKGEIGLAVDGGRTEAEFKIAEGNVESILKPLDIISPLQGTASGVFKLIQVHENLVLSGEFTSPRPHLFGQPVRDVKGNLEWENGILRFPRFSLALFGGIVSGRISLGLSGQEYEMDLAGKDIDLLQIQSGLNGRLSLGLKGKGIFGKDRPRGGFEIKDLQYSPFQKTEARGEWDLNYFNDEIGLDVRGGFFPGENDFTLSVHLPLHQDLISADIRGAVRNLDLLLPWKGAVGRLNYIGEIRGPRSAPKLNGVIDWQGSLLPLPRFAHALNDFTALAFVQGGTISVRSFQGKLGGGDIQGGGEVVVGTNGIEIIDLNMEGKNMLLSPIERTRALADGSVHLIKDSRQFVLDGSFNIARLSWRREITEKFGFSSSPYQARKEKGFFDDLTLNLRLQAAENAWMENSLGRLNGRLDLTVTGNVNSPLIQGDIEALGGEVYFQDRTFKVLRAHLGFFNPSAVEPYLDFRGETYVKNYRVTFSLTGLINNLKPEFTSSPPLPPEDVLALLALGEAFQRTYSYDTSTRLTTASLLSFQIAEQAQKRAEGLFSLARFRIDPFIMGSSAEMTARLTVGRQISRNLSILYSTNLTTQREEIVRMEWEISNDFSLVGMRNELGRISVDVKIRKRF